MPVCLQKPRGILTVALVAWAAVVGFSADCATGVGNAPRVCGNGILEGTEECDDGNNLDGDGCNCTCVVEGCGDGTLDPVNGEECDDGNSDVGDGCDASCQLEGPQNCGDQTLDLEDSEECDDGNRLDGDGCSAMCLKELCGDGVLQLGLGEECDDGNTAPMDGCDGLCLLEVCGDGVLQAALGEECDDGNADSGDGCSDACLLESSCGNGVVEGLEECDDGNVSSQDGCSSSCQPEICGDGELQPGLGEGCDDGNAIAGDGCSDNCQVEFCSDWEVQAGLGETCDDGNLVDCDGCDTNCQLEPILNCGDGSIECGEQCDDGNTVSNDGCSANCALEICGDGIIQTPLGEDCDDRGESATCDDDCTPVSCGDGNTNTTVGETCDDGNTTSGDGCDSSCQIEFILNEDPVANGHPEVCTSCSDDSYQNVTLPWSFPHWTSPTNTASTTTIGFGTNGGLRMEGGYTSYVQIPLWTFSGGAATIHVHGADGFRGATSTMYADVNAQRAIFTYVQMNYCCSTTHTWSAQAVLYPNGNFSIYQIAASTDTSRTITIGLSDGQSTDNAVTGVNGLDWDTLGIGSALSLGQVDWGSSEAGGVATNRFVYVHYNGSSGYTGTVIQ